ncbi:DUF2147 domain-containing protein [Dyella caseinilytica]|uniref:DUF2147 domain-containing protein n=1 Tax=Dyella caseinilytica TaxID=1849581 RepID=A0ABX7GP44_9GAMM|nr:DUF2147 domain-containing protein [Dyella caseinilytica]QRN52195.1 DUF2147 domain-containing protein [Dyella caseinilytica]GGA14035.1 hypothetical protein GCM10011408_39510 [Dyella caseinilytica]
MTYLSKASLPRFAIAACLLFGSAVAWAANDTPVGTWQQVDDETGKVKSIIQITSNNDELQAKVLQVLISEDGPHPVCKKCDGDKKDQPIEGMTIMWGVHADGDVWDGGKILDPKSGTVYKVKLSMADHGQKLDVRGYVGFSLIGRSQTWIRQQ